MSLYFVGFLSGSIIVQKIVRNVGHIRVFAAMASLASTAILLNGLYDSYWIWGISRYLTGFSFASIYVVTESWLNNIANNKNRGSIFSTYLFILNFGLFGGQFFIMLAPIENMDLFVLVSVFISLSLIPISLIHRPVPCLERSDPMPVNQLLKASPLAVFGVLSTGLCGGTFFTIGAVVVDIMGMEKADIAKFMAAYVLGCALMPLGAGWLSDKWGRRKLIIATSSLATLSIMSAAFVPLGSLIFISFICGGFLTSLHGLSIAYVNDHLKPSQFVSASGSMIMINGMASCIGPISATWMMANFGTNSFFMYLSGALFALTLIGIYRSLKSAPPVPITQQTEFIPLPQNATAVAIQITEND